jgi:hypothetical protein
MRAREIQFPQLGWSLRREGPREGWGGRTAVIEESIVRADQLLLVRGPPDLGLEALNRLGDGELVFRGFLPVAGEE